MTDERIHLVVLFGGQSAEHDVSRTTAAHVLAAADPTRYRITPIGISTDGDWAIASEAAAALERGPESLGSQLAIGGESVAPTELIGVPSTAPTVVLPLLHGPLGEDGTVQGLLELANVAYAGCAVLGSAVAMDKAMAKTVMTAHGIPQARYRALRADQATPAVLADAAAELGYPCFVKPANMGSSVGVGKATDGDTLQAAVELALSYDEWIIIEEFIDGREIEVAVIGNTEPVVSTPGEIIPGDEFYTYADKYVDDNSRGLIPADLSPERTAEVQQLALDVFAALRCDGLARCDFFFDEHGRGFVCNEVNTMPGFTPISMFPKLLMADGWTYPEIIDRLVDLAIERHGRRRRRTDY